MNNGHYANRMIPEQTISESTLNIIETVRIIRMLIDTASLIPLDLRFVELFETAHNPMRCTNR